MTSKITSIKNSDDSLIPVASSDMGIVAKLRRLKIEENLLCNNINKPITKDDEENDNFNSSAYRLLITNMKNSYIDTKNLFEEIKVNIQSQENLKALDIDNVKKNIFELETKIKSIKTYLQTELTSLKITEKKLTKQIYENPEIIRRKQKILIKPYNEIIPSPVKVLINTPFKHLEVQQFQEFISNSANRYGGWNEYNHNIFVQSWHKYFQVEENFQLKENSKLFQLFIQEVLRKISGLNFDEIIAHSKWYSKYVYLKKRQQDALDKWKINKKMIKRTKNRIQMRQDTERVKTDNILNYLKKIRDRNQYVDAIDLSGLVSDEFKYTEKTNDQTISDYLEPSCKNLLQENQVEDHKDNLEKQENCLFQKKIVTEKLESTFRISNPTQQWINRCNDKQPTNEYNNVENISKVCIPKWRLGLQENKRQ